MVVWGGPEKMAVVDDTSGERVLTLLRHSPLCLHAVRASALTFLALVALAAAASASAKIIVGSPRADLVRGSAEADTLFGKGGNDRLLGYEGDDRLLGGPGADRLWGGPGSDRIRCGAGSDVAFVDEDDTVASDCEILRTQRPRNAGRPAHQGVSR